MAEFGERIGEATPTPRVFSVEPDLTIPEMIHQTKMEFDLDIIDALNDEVVPDVSEEGGTYCFDEVSFPAVTTNEQVTAALGESGLAPADAKQFLSFIKKYPELSENMAAIGSPIMFNGTKRVFMVKEGRLLLAEDGTWPEGVRFLGVA